VDGAEGEAVNQLVWRDFAGTSVALRPGDASGPSSDEEALAEVLVEHCYRLPPAFDVQAGERWLDLGANIGAFSVYCRQRGATTVCFEPDLDNCEVLYENVRGSGSTIYPCAFTAHSQPVLSMRGSPNPLNRYRGTVDGAVPARYTEYGRVGNLYAGALRDERFDGVKMDIEGSEGDLIDEWLLPACSKLVLEYHTSRDPSLLNLRRRLAILQSHFSHVVYPEACALALRSDKETWQPDLDQIIFCWS
jgi:FkbM family methyltransferase